MANNLEYKDLMAFHPGYYVEEIIDDMEITQEEFAIRLGTTPKTISKLLSGEINLSNDLAIKLSNMLGTSIDVWLNLQKEYEKKKAEIKSKQDIDNQIEIVSMIDYKYFTSLGVVATARKAEDKVVNLRSYLMISDLNVLREKDFLVNYRSATANVTEKNIINSRVWLQTAINMGRKKDVSPFDAKKLKSYIPEIRSMTVKSPKVFLPRLEKIFEDCGVTFVLLPYLKNSGITGAVKWINSSKVILALNDRRTYADGFWFSMFHEIKHVLQQKIKTTFISQENKNMDIESLNENLEKEADDFARTILIPNDEYDAFISKGNFSDSAICSFSEKIDIQPGIVLGRLQHDGYIALNRGTNLRIKYKIIGC